MKSKKFQIWFKWSFFIVALALTSASIFFLTRNISKDTSFADVLSPVSGQDEITGSTEQISPTQLLFPSALQKQQILSAGKSTAPKTTAQFQMRIDIPSINLDAVIEPLGVTSQGALDVPKGILDVGWYDLGPRPGEIGSAVIDGHFGIWKNGTPAVFNNLNKLQKGDQISITDGKGTTTNFVVRETRNYDPKADPTDVFKSNDGKAHLNLITCEGDWNNSTKQYSQRLVVFADKE